MIGNRQYTFGLSEIDLQHDEIEALLADLQERAADRGGRRAILKRLQEKLIEHFALEESVMHLLSHPETRRHIEVHEEILRLIWCCMHDDCSDGRIEDLMRLFVENVRVHDTGLTAYINRLWTFLDGPEIAPDRTVCSQRERRQLSCDTRLG